MKPYGKYFGVVAAGCVAGILVTFVIETILNISLQKVHGVSAEGLSVSAPLLKPWHFLLPWLAHALGTLGASVIVSKYVPSHKYQFALFIGVLFLSIGLTTLRPYPLWYNLMDLFTAYIPMA